MKSILILTAILVLSSVNSYATTFENLKGNYEGGGRAGSGECQISITEDDQGFGQFIISDSGTSVESPKIRISKINNLKIDKFGQFQYELPSKILSLNTIEKWYISGDFFDSKTHSQNAGLLNNLRVKRSVEKRFCLGYDCGVEGEDAGCPVKLD